MSRARLQFCVLGAGVLLLLWGCAGGGPNFVAKREPWRADEETACLSSGVVRETPILKARAALGGPSVCGAARPFEMSGAMGGRVAFQPSAMLRCPMIPQVERWIALDVDPAARLILGSPVVEVKVAASYSCRPMNNIAGGKLSEHGHANALDVSAFVLADGRRITLSQGWRGRPEEQAFLRAVHQGACRTFTTVLGPDSDRHHHDHFHFDLARHGRDGLGRICR